MYCVVTHNTFPDTVFIIYDPVGDGKMAFPPSNALQISMSRIADMQFSLIGTCGGSGGGKGEGGGEGGGGDGAKEHVGTFGISGESGVPI